MTTINQEKINQAAKDWAKRMSSAPDKETPDWIESDFKAGVTFALNEINEQERLKFLADRTCGKCQRPLSRCDCAY